MSYHPNSMHMASSRPQTHVYQHYLGAGGMQGKPTPTSASQMGGAAAGYPPMYFVQGPQYAYQPGVDGKYSGGGRSVPEQPGVIVNLAPSGMLYPGQHMPPSGTMLIQGGQQMIVGHPPQIYQQPGPPHQQRLRFAPPPSGQYGMGGGAGSAAGPVAQQQPQQQQQQQQQYYGGYPGNQQHPQQPPASTVQKREKKILQFVNPDTGKTVNLSTDQGTSASTSEAEAVAAAVSEQTIAAQFAAQVAATLTSPASSLGPQKPNISAPVIEEKADKYPVAAPSVSKAHPALPLEEPVSSERPVIPSSQPGSRQEVPQSGVSTTPEVLRGAVGDAVLEVSSVKAKDLPSSETVNKESPASEASSQLPTAVSSKSSTPVDEAVQSKSGEVTSSAPSAVKETVESTPAQQLQSNKASAAASVPASGSAASESAVDNGNKKKNRKKNKDLNSKGQVLQGSDMDAFIDESHAEEKKSKPNKLAALASSAVVVNAVVESKAAVEEIVAPKTSKDSGELPDNSPSGAISLPTSVPVVATSESEVGHKNTETKDAEQREKVEVASSQPNSKTADPSAKVSEARREVVAPKNADVVPKDSTVVPKDAAVVSKDSTIAPKEATTVPKDSIVVPKNASVTPKDATVELKDTTVVSKVATEVPKDSTVEPKDAPLDPKVTTVVPKDTTVVPKDSNVVPKDATVAPKSEVVAVPHKETSSEDSAVEGKSGVKETGENAETFQTQENAEPAAAAETVAPVASVSEKEREADDAESGSGTELEAPASASSNKSDLKYTYSEDQWSPLNPEGKKQYDRSFMLQLQFANPSIIKPVGLPSLPDIILNEPRVKNDFSRQNSNADPSSPIDFTPTFIKRSLGGGGSVSRGSMKKGSGGGGSMKRVTEQPQRKVIHVSIEHNITLHTSENAWKPAAKQSKEGDLENEELYKKIRGILNKLTPQKFQTLIQQVQHLPINTEERLTGCIDIIFEKAISEPNFSVAYANMAKCLMTISVPAANDPSQMIGFRKLLLNKCQQEFEKDKMEELDIENLESQIAEADTEEKRKALIEQRDATIYRAKRRSLGNIRFIGELFKLKMLTEKIMHECLSKLLKSYKDEDSLECLCQLLTTIGQDIEKKPSGPTIMNKYFTELQELSDLKKTSSRIRFMIQDVIELRKNKWVPRRQNNNPKTIEQIHKEAEQEEQEKQIALQKFTQDQRTRRAAATPVRTGPPMLNPHSNDDGWTAVSRAPKSIVDPTRMKLNKQPMDENFQLGPGGRGMSAWHRGSNGGAKAQETERPTSTPNRFSALGGFGSESMDARSRPNNRVGSGYTGRLSGPQSRAPVSRHSQERGNSDASFRGPGGAGHNTGAFSLSGSRSSSQDTRTAPEAKAPVDAGAGASVSRGADDEKEVPEEEIERKTKSLMDEYLHGHDIKEAALCVKELGSSKSLRLFVYHSLLQNLERSSQARNFTGMLHLHLVKTKQMTVDHYVDGLRSILEFADEMTIDIPRIWEYLGELVSPMIEDGTISMAFLRSATEPLLACDKAGLVIARVLHTAAHSLGHHRAAELWHLSGLKWTDFVTSESLDAFLQEQKLQFTEEKRSSETGNNLSSEQVQIRLAKLLEDSETNSERLIDFIDDSVDEKTAYSASFIRAFTSSLCSCCVLMHKNPTVDQVKLKKFLPVLSRYIKSRKELEVQVLFALQALVHKLEHPPGILRAFFDTLYDDEVITEDSFYEWRKCSEPGESAGKGVALQTVIQFFHWLEENEDGN